MANTKQAAKRVRQAAKHRLSNKWQLSRVQTFIKRIHAALASQDLPGAQEAFRLTSSCLDKLARKGIIHKNKAARCKSRLNKRIKALAIAPAAA